MSEQSKNSSTTIANYKLQKYGLREIPDDDAGNLRQNICYKVFPLAEDHNLGKLLLQYANAVFNGTTGSGGTEIVLDTKGKELLDWTKIMNRMANQAYEAYDGVLVTKLLGDARKIIDEEIKEYARTHPQYACEKGRGAGD